MAIVYLTGFEHGSLDMFDVQKPAGSIQGTTKRNGSYAYKGSTSGNPGMFAVPTGTDFSVRFALFIDSSVSGGSGQTIFAFGDGGTSVHGRVYINTSFVLTARDSGSTTWATAAQAPPTDQWLLCEILYKCAQTGGKFDLYVNGSTTSYGFTYTGDTTGLAGTTVGSIGLLFNGAGNNKYTIDDLAIDNAQSTTRLGEGKVLAMTVSGAGDNTQLTGVGDVTNRYANVDEVPPNDTDYNYSAAATGTNEYDLYNTNTITNVSAVNAICVWMRGYKDDAGTGNARIKIKTPTNAGATPTEYDNGADLALPQTTPAYFRNVRTTNPNGGGAWTTTALDALQIGFDGR